MIDVCVLGCDGGKGAAAPFNGVHILGEIWPEGGVDTLAKLQWKDLIGPSILVQKSTIPQSTLGGLLVFGDWPWDGTVALFVATEIRGYIRCLGAVEGTANW